MGLTKQVSAAFAADGVLGRLVTPWIARQGQQEMALAVASVIESGGTLVVEAGTGIGKTYAYLVPSLLSGERVLISTATKALQDQLFRRDLPRLLSAFQLPVRVVLLKGRGSYLCLHHLQKALDTLQSDNLAMHGALDKVRRWASETRTGDLAELDGLDEDAPAMALVTSTRENCLGSACPQHASCHVNAARRAALGADVVVLNHHLFFADFRIRESGIAELLPDVSVVVFDEAHQLNDVGLQFLSNQWSLAQLMALIDDIVPFGPQLALVTPDWTAAVNALSWSVDALRRAFARATPGRYGWQESMPFGISAEVWQRLIGDLTKAVDMLASSVRALDEHQPGVIALGARLDHWRGTFDEMAQSPGPAVGRWLEVGSGLRWYTSPLSIAGAMQTVVAPLEASPSRQKSWVFTSATLGHDAQLSWFVDACGLQGAHVLQVPSPFDYVRQAVLYVPRHVPAPDDPLHSDCVALLAAHVAQTLGGRTLVLTTTLRAMRSIGKSLEHHFAACGDMDVLVQGEHSKRTMIERFTCLHDNKPTRSVMVASASFWQGIDIPGEFLQAVIIDKLPFAPPDDPLVAARSRAMELAGKKPFVHLHIPHAAIVLKQGAGRLIRSETDRGVLVVCDVRLVEKGYGKKILRSLSPMAVANSYEEFEEALQAITKVSTRDPAVL